MLTAAKADSMLGLCAAVSSAGYVITNATPSGVALYEAFRFNYPEIRESAMIVDVGARSTHLLFVAEGRFFGRTLPLGGNAVTQSVADELGVDFASAEKLKLELLLADGNQLSHSLPWRAVQAGAENFCAKLQAEITRSTVNLRRQTSADHPTALYITGGGSRLETLTRSLGEKLKLPVLRFDPLRRVEVSSQVEALVGTHAAVLLSQLVGLATRLIVKNHPTVNLLPLVIRNELAFRRRQPAVIAAAALILMALLPPIRHFHSRAVAAQSEATEIETQLQPLRALAKRNTELLQHIERTRKLVDELQGVVDKKTNWLRFLKDLQDRLVTVEDVWLDSLSIARDPSPEVAPASGSGAATANLRLVLSGRLLDRNNPISKVSAESYARVKQLIASFGGSEFIASIDHERFDNSQPGILRFDFTLVVRPQKPL
jgi:type IV pilus assembly protein PilM